MNRRTDGLDPAILDRYVGNYDLDMGPTVELRREEGKLFVDMGDGNKIELKNRKDKEFFVEGLGARVVFDMADDKPAKSFTAYVGDQTIHAKRVAEKPGQDLASFAGTYYSPELDTIYRIVESDGALVARHQRHSDIKLKAAGTTSSAARNGSFPRCNSSGARMGPSRACA